ncbi:Glycosyl hydrolases family 43 [Bifidobacterium bohemicum]|uniref:Family 43 glycoside hydrolase n=1 Tax=Bifidobacterium bohemicum DSM 22767 TaxID=1437606 RepID=A0A086ZDW4_9BIFI|nr:family 43 glycosylhydrolase [Bifidobacterium bohemicum]KFI44714.1 family 43 glycoside hydrolase [Bifidobacterium bohemicum DSM 22767]SCC18312.1 Glycosyl hydrolases family 43 [Bifidobacterium bohemicum]
MAKMKGVQLFRDEVGNVAQLHGIGVLCVGSTWYAYGERKNEGRLFQGVACYSTNDFVHWRAHGDALAMDAGKGFLGAGRVVERPRVLCCPSSGRYVMYLHVEGGDDYSFAHIGFALSDSPTGPFELFETVQFHGNESRDIGVFQDDDGTGYLLSEDRQHGTHVYRLSPDYLSIVEDVVCLKGTDYWAGYESPVMLKSNGLYYWFGSELTGWDCNDNRYATASDLHGPWSRWRPFAPLGTRTFDSQCDAIVPIDSRCDAGGGVDDKTESSDMQRFLYIGDRWSPDDLGGSPLVTLPIEIGDGHARLQWHDEWDNGL